MEELKKIHMLQTVELGTFLYRKGVRYDVVPEVASKLIADRQAVLAGCGCKKKGGH